MHAVNRRAHRACSTVNTDRAGRACGTARRAFAGNLATITALSGTSQAVTGTYTYESVFNRPTTYTDGTFLRGHSRSCRTAPSCHLESHARRTRWPPRRLRPRQPRGRVALEASVCVATSSTSRRALRPSIVWSGAR